MLYEHEEIINLIVEGVSPRGIAARMGMNEVAARRLINQLIKEHKIDYVVTVVDDLPYGLTQETVRLRIYLGARLYDLRQQHGGDRDVVGRLVGLNRREQIRAEQRPYSHNWDLSQIERLSRATSIPIREMLNGPSVQNEF